jgi:methylated-DNA-[protein]-cysteine S-methyltransferase
MAHHVAMVDSPLGALAVHEHDGVVTAIDFAERAARVPPSVLGDSAVLTEARRQLAAYFAGGLHDFHLPLDPHGTDFQQRVWQQLRTIPWGQTRSYGWVAAELGLPPGAARAVGAANGANPLPIVVPCHRVIGSDGTLTGYAGGLARKETLLRLEGLAVPGDQGRLF